MLGIAPPPFLEDWFSSLHSITILKPFPPSAMLSHCSAPNVLLVRVTLGGSRDSGWVGSPWAAMEVVWRITKILGKQLTAEDDLRHNHPNKLQVAARALQDKIKVSRSQEGGGCSNRFCMYQS